MLHYQLSGTFLTMFVTGHIFITIKHLARTTDPEEKATVRKQSVQSAGKRKQKVYEKKAGTAKPYFTAKEANLPVD